MSSELTRQYRSESGDQASVLELTLDREDDGGIIFVSTNAIPSLFIALKEESELRPAVEKCLKSAYASNQQRVQVYVNGKIDGPHIGVMVKLTPQ